MKRISKLTKLKNNITSPRKTRSSNKVTSDNPSSSASTSCDVKPVKQTDTKQKPKLPVNKEVPVKSEPSKCASISDKYSNVISLGTAIKKFEVTTETVPIKQEFSDSEIKQELSDTEIKQELSDNIKLKREHIKIEYENGETAGKNIKADVKVRYPPNWEVVLGNLREMRKGRTAPVDTMGCDSCPDNNANEKDKRYQALLSLMLSSQTKDQITHAAMQKLIQHGCNVSNILATSDEKLGELIYPVGFWKTKVKYIKQSTKMIRDQYDGDIPKTAKELCKLVGVGPKMAHLCMKTAWGEVTGIGVDTHVHRICNRLGWCVTKTPEGTRKALEGWLPRQLWPEVNHLLVGFGQEVCQPVRPHCATCMNCDVCPSNSQRC